MWPLEEPHGWTQIHLIPYPSYCDFTSILRQGLAPPCDGVGVAAIKASATKNALDSHKISGATPRADRYESLKTKMAQKEETSIQKQGSPCWKSPEIRGEIIDSGHFWGKSLTPIPTWKSHFRDLCDLYVEAHFFTFAICFIKTDLITNSSLQRLYMLRIKHIVSQQQTGTSLHSTKTKRQFFWSFLKNPHPPFWLGFFKINRQQHIDLSILLSPQVYPPRDSLPVGSPHWQNVF